MNLIGYLNWDRGSQQTAIDFEYRLLCSGTLFNSRVQTSDWRKSDASRVILFEPLVLIACSSPIDEYPQELSLQFFAPEITITMGQSTKMFFPDRVIASDVAAFLSLIFRRHITVAAKIREIYPTNDNSPPAFPDDWPVAFITDIKPQYWEPKPSTFTISREGITDVTDYNPPDLGVDPKRVELILTKTASHPLGESLLLCSRLYSLALHHLHTDLDLAYQLLVSSVEAIANPFLKSLSPPRDELIAHNKKVYDLATEMSLSKEDAEELAAAASSGNSWVKRKFVQFLIDFAGEEVWEPDSHFHLPEFLIPSKDQFDKKLSLIYDARSGATHRGRSFPRSAQIGLGPMIPTDAVMSYDPVRNEIPPVVWFERVVNSSLVRFISDAIVNEA